MESLIIVLDRKMLIFPWLIYRFSANIPQQSCVYLYNWINFLKHLYEKGKCKKYPGHP